MLTTPVIRCLKKQYPGAEVHFLTKKSFYPILELNPYLDKIYLLENSLDDLIKLLKKENYDYIIDLHNNIRSKTLIIKLRKTAQSFNKLNLKKWLLVNFKINHMPHMHIVDRYLETLKPWGIINDLKGLDYFISKTNEQSISKLPEPFGQGYIGFVIGGQHATKRMPIDKISSIVQRINFPVVLLGGKEDQDAAKEIISICHKEDIYNACGMFSFNDSAGIIKGAKKIITHDTGLMHVAAAYKKDIISIWGNTVPEFGMYPYLGGEKSKIVQVDNLSCRPCSKIGFKKCPKKHFNCMNLIDEDQIIQWVNTTY